MSGPLISSAELFTQLNDSNVRVVDCRFDLGDPDAGRRDYLAGHIPGAVFVDLDRDLAGPVTPATGRHPLPSAAALADRLGVLGIDNASSVVVYDAGSGALAARAWWLLRWLGHEDVRLLDRGLSGWTSLGHALEAGDVVVEASSYRPKVREDVTITTDEVMNGLASASNFLLADARDARRFRGEIEPIDPVAGHIPGAVNLPFVELLDEEGGFRAPAELGERLTHVLGSDDGSSWAVMCGSGVTACHLAIAAVAAGRTEPLLYVGSWSEWIRDPERPVGREEHPD